MALVSLVGCRVGSFGYDAERLHGPRTGHWQAHDIARLQQVARVVGLQGWETLRQHVARCETWATLTTELGLTALEQQRKALEPLLEEARRERKRLATRERQGVQQEHRAMPGRGWWPWPRARAEAPARPALSPDPQGEAAQEKLEAIAREFSALDRTIKARQATRWVQTFEGMRVRWVWLLADQEAEPLLQELERRHLCHVWRGVPSLLLSCPVGLIPQETSGHPGERVPERWYFRSGLLALHLLGTREQPQHRQELQELEEWLTSQPGQAAELAAMLEGVAGTNLNTALRDVGETDG